MKKNLDGYEQYYYKQGTRKRGKKSFFAFLFILLTLAVVVFFSISFSSFLTVSKVVNINTNYIVTEKYLYAISLGSFEKIDDAQTFSDDIKKQGAGGVIFYNENYKVLSSIYPKQSDAKSVQENLKKSGTESEVIKIKMDALNFKVELSSKSQKVLGECLNLFYNSYKCLYDTSILLDKQEIDTIKTKENILNLHESNKKKIDAYIDYFKSSSNVYILYTKIYLSKLDKMLEDLKKSDEQINLSSKIKETYCQIIFLYNDLCNEIDV